MATFTSRDDSLSNQSTETLNPHEDGWDLTGLAKLVQVVDFVSPSDEPGTEDDSSPRPDECTESADMVAVKKCSICFEEIHDTDDIHQALAPACSYGAHTTYNEFICTICLKKHLDTQMFPLDQDAFKHKFPSPTVRCWSWHCRQTIPHHLVQKYTDPEAFSIYDQQLCRRYLQTDESVFKCAFEDCNGAEWAENKDCINSNIFRCPVCSRDTCRECNGPYEMHSDRPCPAGENHRNPPRVKLEETRSKIKLKMKHKCPNCPLRYEKISGCDHIVCGGGSSVEGGHTGKSC